MTLEFKYVFSELQIASQDSHIQWDGLPLLEGEDEDPSPCYRWWYVERGVVLGTQSLYLKAPTGEEKKLIQLDAQAKDEIGGHLNRAQFICYRQCETVKDLWDVLEKINEGVSTHKEDQIDTLRATFNRFKRIGNGSC